MDQCNEDSPLKLKTFPNIEDSRDQDWQAPHLMNKDFQDLCVKGSWAKSHGIVKLLDFSFLDPRPLLARRRPRCGASLKLEGDPGARFVKIFSCVTFI